MATVLDVLRASKTFKTFTSAVDAAGMADTLETDDITVFAPTDAAFSALPAETILGLLNDKRILSDVLARHIVHTRLDDNTRKNTTMVQTFGSENLPVSGDTISGATIVTGTVEAENGVVSGIDQVLLSAPDQSEPPVP